MKKNYYLTSHHYFLIHFQNCDIKIQDQIFRSSVQTFYQPIIILPDISINKHELPILENITLTDFQNLRQLTEINPKQIRTIVYSSIAVTVITILVIVIIIIIYLKYKTKATKVIVETPTLELQPTIANYKIWSPNQTLGGSSYVRQLYTES